MRWNERFVNEYRPVAVVWQIILIITDCPDGVCNDPAHPAIDRIADV